MKAGWCRAELQTLTTTFADGDWIETKDQSDSGIRLIQTGNVGDGVFKDRAEKARFINEETFKRIRCTEIHAGDCLISRLPDPVGRACIIPETGERMITAVDCTILRFDRSTVLPEFFVYFAQSRDYLSEIAALSTGTTRPRVSRANLGRVTIPLPPLDEQKRIVTVLDEAFEGLARARANAEANLAGAQELYSNALEQALLECSAPFSDLGSHVDQLVGYAFKSSDFTENPADIRLMRGDNIVPGGIRWEGTKHWRADRVDDFERYFLQPHDVLIAMDRTWIKAGIKFAVVAEEDTPSLLVQRVARLRARSTILVDFLAALIRSRDFERYVLSIQTGTGVPHISGGQINAFPVRVPAIEIQAKIMDRLNAILSAAVEIATNIQSSATELQTLRKALLEKAFSGKLT